MKNGRQSAILDFLLTKFDMGYLYETQDILFILVLQLACNCFSIISKVEKNGPYRISHFEFHICKFCDVLHSHVLVYIQHLTLSIQLHLFSERIQCEKHISNNIKIYIHNISNNITRVYI